MKNLFLICFLLTISRLSSQNHDYYWPMGYASFNSDTTFGRTVIDFNEEPPLVYREDRNPYIDATVASYCDTSGTMVYYTNGSQILNSDHEIVPNGNNLNTGPYAISNGNAGYRVPNSEFFLPMPGHKDSLLLVHISIDDDDVVVITGRTLHQTTLTLNDSNGGLVVSKNVPLLDSVSIEVVSATKHANGRDWWVFCNEKTKNSYYKMLLTDKGVVSTEWFELPPAFPFLYAGSYFVFSPDGSKMARYYVTNGAYIYDFDRCSGTFSNPVFVPLPNTSLGGGLSISPNSRFLYIMSTDEVYQFDLWADNVAASRVTVAVWDGFYYPFPTTFFLSQLGPDGRVYINATNGVRMLHMIQYPNKKGLACEVRQHGMLLPTYNAFTIPPFPNYRLGPLDGSPCDTLGLDNMPIAKFRYEQDTLDFLQVEFTDLSYYEPAEWSWYFGDNTTSQDTSPVHIFPQAGTYEVCLTVSNVNGEHTFCRTLSLGTVSTAEEAEQVTITVFPNPCREGVNITFNDYLPRDAKIVLYDAVGQRQKVQSVQTGWNTVRLDGQPAGIYFYEIWEGASPEPASGRVLLDSGKLVKVE
ncbi:MAG: PKD domain-containing protein [Saprospiraceae bacterium]